MPFKSLGNLLKPNEDGGLGEIIGHAQQMGELVDLLQQTLPSDMAGSIRAANIRDDGELIVLASSPAWAAKLRFETEALIASARSAGSSVLTCSVRVSRT